HCAVRQFLGDGGGVNRARVRHADRDIDEHVLGRFAQHPKEAEAGVADGVRNGALGGLGGVPSVDVDAHAHFSDTAHACHGVSYIFLSGEILIGGSLISQSSLAAPASSTGTPEHPALPAQWF